MRLIGYGRRSTDEPPTTLDAQNATIRAWAAGAAHEVVTVVLETIQGGTDPEYRPKLGPD